MNKFYINVRGGLGDTIRRYTSGGDGWEYLSSLKENGYNIGWANGPPRAWTGMEFLFAVGTKDDNKLNELGGFVEND